MRLFLGIPVPQRIAQGLLHHARSLKLGAESPRWTRPENMHLTLVFLGEVAEEKLAAIAAELETLTVTKIDLHVAGLRTFARAGVLFVEVERAPALLRLQADVAQRMARIGFMLEERAYHPHLTLARMRSLIRVKPAQLALPHSVAQGFSAHEVILYRSRPTAGGSQYEPLIRKAAG